MPVLSATATKIVSDKKIKRNKKRRLRQKASDLKLDAQDAKADAAWARCKKKLWGNMSITSNPGHQVPKKTQGPQRSRRRIRRVKYQQARKAKMRLAKEAKAKAYFSFLMQQNKCQKPPQSSGALAAAAATLGACFLVGPVAGQTAITDSNIDVAADGWSDNIDPADGYGPIVDWDVSAVTSMHQVFYNADLDQDIGRWDVSSVTTTSQMFKHAGAFDQDIGSWDVSAVTNMYQMFRDAGAFDQDIGSWDVSAVKTMYQMLLSSPVQSAPLNGCSWKKNAMAQAEVTAGRMTFSSSTCTESPTAGPTRSPTVSGDPHLTGLQGQQFDLMGRPGAQYNLITDQRAQVHISTNVPFFEHSADAKLRASGNHAGLFMTGVHVAYLDANGLAHVVSFLGDFNSTVRHHERHCDGRNSEGSCLRGLQVHINGGEVASPTTTKAAVGKGAELRLENNACPFSTRDGSCKTKATNGGHGLATLVTPSVVIEVGAAFFNNRELMHKTVHHLDLALSEYRPSGKPHGLIGQTVELRHDSDGKAIMKGAGCIEGVEDDYIVSGLDTAKLRNSAFSEGSSFSASADGVAADGVKRT